MTTPTNTPVGTLYRRAVKRVDRRSHVYGAAIREHAALTAAHPTVAPSPDTCATCGAARTRLAEACRLANNLAQSLPVHPSRRLS